MGGLELPSSQLSGVVFAGSTVSMAEHRRVGFLSRRFALIIILQSVTSIRTHASTTANMDRIVVLRRLCPDQQNLLARDHSTFLPQQ